MTNVILVSLKADSYDFQEKYFYAYSFTMILNQILRNLKRFFVKKTVN